MLTTYLSSILIAFVCAELSFILVRSQDIQIILKSQMQRTNIEQYQVDRGLGRSLLLELLLFVPASVTLVLFIAPLLSDYIIKAEEPTSSQHRMFYALLGMISYGFPFATLRRVLTRIALKTLQEFATLGPHELSEKSKMSETQ